MHLQEFNQLKDFLFVRYKEAASQPALWLQQSLNTFRESLLDLCQPNRISAHAPLERSPPHQTPTSTLTNDNNLSANNVLAAQTKQIMDNLMTSCVVLRIENFTLYRVTTSGKKQMPKEFISGEKYRIVRIYIYIHIFVFDGFSNEAAFLHKVVNKT